MSERKITGLHVFAVTASAFAVIIGVNLVMAYQAISTFPGLETKNSYVASQSFNQDRAAQIALGWNAKARLEGNQLYIAMLDPSGQPADVDVLTAVLGRPTHVEADQEPEFVISRGEFVAEIGDLEPGMWLLRIAARSSDGIAFRRSLKLFVPNK